MIVLKMEIDNLYMFRDFKIDFTYPREIKKTILQSERVQHAPKIRYKKLNIMMGGNASGKTTLGKLLCSFQNYLRGHSGDFFFKKYKKDDNSTLKILFVENEYLFKMEISFDNNTVQEKLKAVKLRKSYNLEKHLELLNKQKEECVEFSIFLDQKDVPILSQILKRHFIGTTEMCAYTSFLDIPESQQNYITYFSYYLSFYFRFASFTDRSFQPGEIVTDESLPMVQKLLMMIDNSIAEVRRATSDNVEKTESTEENGYYIIFTNGDRVYIDQETPRMIKDNRLSQGTIEAMEISYIINNINKYRGTIYLDEQMAYMHTELSNALILMLVNSVNKLDDVQLFITSHNENILNLNVPNHSFTFLKNEKNKVRVINPEKTLQKNDRSLLEYVQNNYFDSYPDLEDLGE